MWNVSVRDSVHMFTRPNIVPKCLYIDKYIYTEMSQGMAVPSTLFRLSALWWLWEM